MLGKKQIPICQNHLAALYESLERDDLKSVYQIEHQLTREEECVACAYLLKAKGSAEEALELYLKNEGFRTQVATSSGRVDRVLVTIKFAIFLMLLFGILALEIFFTGTIKPFGMIVAIIFSVFGFIFINEQF